MNREQVISLLLQVSGTTLNVCGALCDDRQTQLLGGQIRHIGRLRGQRNGTKPESGLQAEAVRSGGVGLRAAADRLSTSANQSFS